MGRSEARQKEWADPEVRARRCAAISAAAKRRYADPREREKTAERTRSLFTDLEWKAKWKTACAKHQSDPVFLAKLAAASRRTAASRAQTLRETLSRPETRAARLDQLAARRADAEAEARRLAAARAGMARAKTRGVWRAAQRASEIRDIHSRAAVEHRELLRATQARRRGSFYISPVTGVVVAMRSRLEARYAACLDTMDIPWVFEPCGYEIEGQRRYIPDFAIVLHDGAELVEVKRSTAPSQVRKLRAFERSYPDVPIRVIRQREIRALEATCGRGVDDGLLLELRVAARTGAVRDVAVHRIHRAVSPEEIQALLHNGYLAQRRLSEVRPWH